VTWGSDRSRFEYVPGWRTLRTFVERVYQLFDPQQSEHQTYCRRAALQQSDVFAAVPELAKAMGMLDAVRFPKMVAFLKSPAAKRLRTNNHVERTHRKLRYYEKVRYKWRQRRNIIRFLLLAVGRWWREHRSTVARTAPTKSRSVHTRATRTKRSRRAKQTTYNVSG